MLPKISVIIPTFNRKNEMLVALNSVLNQTYKNLEVIVIDDGSTDGTEALISDISDNRMKYIYQQNKGVSVARNKGIANATGDYLAFLDSDDEWFARKLEIIVQHLLKNNKAIFVFSNGYVDNDNQLAWESTRQTGFIFENENSNPFTIGLPAPSSWVFSKEIFEKIGIFDESFRTYEDQDLLVRLFMCKIPFYFINEPLLRWGNLKARLTSLEEFWVLDKEKFYEKHRTFIEEDRKFCFRFLSALCKDFIAVDNKKLAQKYWWEAFKTNPFKIKNIGRFFKAYL